jgi:hypothetical protein
MYKSSLLNFESGECLERRAGSARIVGTIELYVRDLEGRSTQNYELSCTQAQRDEFTISSVRLALRKFSIETALNVPWQYRYSPDERITRQRERFIDWKRLERRLGPRSAAIQRLYQPSEEVTYRTFILTVVRAKMVT